MSLLEFPPLSTDALFLPLHMFTDYRGGWDGMKGKEIGIITCKLQYVECKVGNHD